ncbi:polysaccharide deacetylase family protein [Polynucleobacter antarcticus]|uniref:4-deoxy-4-formamido-L-arabinose-phosphoundecaprenol deformylase n=1 Tax=Polynucleobacter antarcticus TaxID=1743162 RepID=A0A6M9PU88_9BURK|nr:polysaccharide deacetylase family protein [Polynucleobacter antarcticus]QKM63018.1 4-deoxy-4-formamido-L-arabinose-phosphoundecaprenol deformylase [Polynucleobacter antarcticus]
MAKIALKVDVDTLRGTKEGVPNLARTFERFGLKATFLFSLGPDHTGWALKRVFRPGFLKKVSRTSVVEHYGIKTLLYGVLLPGPDIGKQAAAEMRAIDLAGHETGIHTWDHTAWQDAVRNRDAQWTQIQMQKSWDRFVEIFGHPPATYGAAGWQMNEAAFEQLDLWGIAYSSDGRAGANLAPYRFALPSGKAKHVQYPTTLPTFDELIGIDDADEFAAVKKILELTQSNPNDQVFTLHAELEGQKLLPAFEQLLAGWLNQGHDLVTMGELHQSWAATKQLDKIAVQPVTWGEIPNRSGELILQAA